MKMLKKLKENHWIQDEFCPRYYELPGFQDCGLRVVAIESFSSETTEKPVKGKKKQSTIALVKTNRSLLKTNEALYNAIGRLEVNFKTVDEEKINLQKKLEQQKEEHLLNVQNLNNFFKASKEIEINMQSEIVREGFKKKIVEFSTKRLTPPLPLVEKN